MSEGLVEAIARALRNGDASYYDISLVEADAPVPAYYLARAQAALTAINEAGLVIVPRVPTEEMLIEMWGDSPHQFPGGDWVEASTDLKRIYRAAITTGETGQ